MSIKKILKKIRFNGRGEKNKSTSQWVEVIGGPLKGHQMMLNLGESAASWNKEMFEGCYDTFIYDNLDTIVATKDAIVWDVGAHIGYHTLAFAALVGPGGHVFAFEPNQENIYRLSLNLDRNKDLKEHITILTSALGNVEGEEDFIFNPDVDNGRSSGSHLKRAFVPEEMQSYKSFSEKKINMITADALLRDKIVSSPSIIKIDVEGAESFVIEGANHLLSSRHPVLLIEVHHITAMHDTLNILLRLGYQTKIIENAPNSSSRCFIVAQSRDTILMESVTTKKEITL
ncbi:MAG: FkbM family methyltransferase [Anaerolineaceae bacterium]|nr:FkbM family methyltransferase [Anaerolineaceae bacterium]